MHPEPMDAEPESKDSQASSLAQSSQATSTAYYTAEEEPPVPTPGIRSSLPPITEPGHSSAQTGTGEAISAAPLARNPPTIPRLSAVKVPSPISRPQNALERYRSRNSSSLPDYGSRRGAHEMDKVRKMLGLGSFQPVNTLTGNSRPEPVPQPSEPRSKRQKLSHPQDSHTDAHFALRNDRSESRLVSRDRSLRGSENGMAAGSIAGGSFGMLGVKEFNSVESHVRPAPASGRRKEARASQYLSSRRTSVPEDIDASEDELSRDCNPSAKSGGTITNPRTTQVIKTRRVKPHGNTDITGDGADSQFHPTRKPGHMTRKHAGHTGSRADQGAMEDGADELAGVPKGSEKVPTRNSSNLTRRGDIKSGLEASIRRQFQLKAACRHPRHYYESASDKEIALYLSNAPDSTRFQAVDDNGNHTSWLSFDLGKIHSLSHSTQSPIIAIRGPSDGARGGLVMLEFFDQSQVVRFIHLVEKFYLSSNRETVCSRTTAAELEKLFNGTHMRVTQAAKLYKPGDQRPEQRELEFLNQNQASRVSKTVDGTANSEASRTRSGLMKEPATRGPPLRAQMQLSSTRPMQTDSQRAVSDFVHAFDGDRSPRPVRSTRTTRASQNAFFFDGDLAISEPEYVKWTEENRGWDKDWQMPLVFNRTSVDKEDIQRLDEGEFLNDNLIDFGLKYLFEQAKAKNPALEDRVFIHNTFFFKNLKDTEAGGSKINYAKVRSWTAKKDILNCDYIVVPVNESFHWWVAIICNPGRMDPDLVARETADVVEQQEDDVMEVDQLGQVISVPESSDQEMSNGDGTKSDPVAVDAISSDRPDQIGNSGLHGRVSQSADGVIDLDKETADVAVSEKAPLHAGKPRKGRKSMAPVPRKHNPKDPRAITLDSLGGGHSPAAIALRSYLVAEFQDKRGKIIENPPSPFGMKAGNIPEQSNHCDCGIFLLGYVGRFLEDPDKFVEGILQRQTTWKFDPNTFRADLRQGIFTLQREYQERQLKIRRDKAAAKAARQAPKLAPIPQAKSSPGRQPPKAGGEGLIDGRNDVAPPATAPPAAISPDIPGLLPLRERSSSPVKRTNVEGKSSSSQPRSSQVTVVLCQEPPINRSEYSDIPPEPQIELVRKTPGSASQVGSNSMEPTPAGSPLPTETEQIINRNSEPEPSLEASPVLGSGHEVADFELVRKSTLSDAYKRQQSTEPREAAYAQQDLRDRALKSIETAEDDEPQFLQKLPDSPPRQVLQSQEVEDITATDNAPSRKRSSEEALLVPDSPNGQTKRAKSKPTLDNTTSPYFPPTQADSDVKVVHTELVRKQKPSSPKKGNPRTKSAGPPVFGSKERVPKRPAQSIDLTEDDDPDVQFVGSKRSW